MKRILSLLSTLVIVLFAAAPVPLAAQDEGNQDSGISRRTARAPEPFKGFNSYAEFHGSVTSSETLLKLDSSLGYDFNQYAGVFVGVPLYFVHDSAPAAREDLSGSATGDVYFGVDLYAPTPVVNYSTTFTVSAPTGSVSKGFSTGHRTLDWTNRLRRKIGRLAPFLAAGISNTVPDSDLITRTFTSLRNVIHLEEGAEYDLTRRVYAGASAYHIIPFGTPNVLNQLNGSQPADRGPGNGNDGLGDGNAQAPPPASPAVNENRIRENGVDLWLGFEPTRVVRLEAGYSRSLTFALNRFSFNVGLNVGRLFRERARQE